MNIKKIFIISIILMFLSIPVSFAEDLDYTIPKASEDIIINDDGSTFISEKISFNLEKTVNGVYRDIPHDSEQSIINISVETPGYYNAFKVINEDNKTRIKIWLYEDEEKTRKVSANSNVNVNIKYTFNKGVKIYNDIAEFQYMSWGDEWESSVGTLKTVIHIPGSNSETEYWNNPETNVVSSIWTNDNTLETVLENIHSHKSFEQRILMPKSYFKSYDNAKVINIDAKKQIEKDQKEYAQRQDFKNKLSEVLIGIMGILMIIPVGVYTIFGREPKINYKADYEYNLPTNSSPIEVNLILHGNVGVIDENAIYATILSLINKKYYKIMSSTENDTIIRQSNKNLSGLKQYEKSLMDYLSKFNKNGDLSLKSIADEEDPVIYKDFKSSWIKEAKKEVPDGLVESYFENKGYKIFNNLSILLLIIGVIGWLIFYFIDYDDVTSLMIVAISSLLIIESIIMFVMPNTVSGRWTIKGKEYNDKWKNFEKYLKDYSLINEHPPASVEIWGKYLIYATALGCAADVSKNMKKYFDLNNISENYYYDDDLVRFVYFGGFTHMDSAFSSLVETDSRTDSIGSVGGGGFGGGGGGTF